MMGQEGSINRAGSGALLYMEKFWLTLSNLYDPLSTNSCDYYAQSGVNTAYFPDVALKYKRELIFSI